MFHLKDNFRPNAPISQVPASWFNAVASFLNNLVGGYGVKINKNGAIPVVSIVPEVLAEHSKDKPTTQHVELETPSENQDFASKGHVYNEANDAWSLHDTTWVRGGKKGLKIYLPTDSWGDGSERCTAWRLCSFDRQGRLAKVEGQSIVTKSAI